MNQGATIMLDHIRRCAYFLSLMDGPEVAGWTETTSGSTKSSKTPQFCLPECQLRKFLEADFRHAFADAGRKRALDDLMVQKWKMAL